MKNERQANFAMVARAESGFKGSLGERRQPHPRPSFFVRLFRRFFA